MRVRLPFLMPFILGLLFSVSPALPNEDDAQLSKQQAKCEDRWSARLSPGQDAFGEDPCAPYASALTDLTANYAESAANKAHGPASPRAPAVQNDLQPLRIATGSAGWEYNRTGAEICRKLNGSGHFRCRAIVTHGSLQNIKLLEDAKVNLALSQSDMIPEDSVDFISLKTLSRQALYIFVRENSNIESVHDLMHKRVNTGPIGSGLRGTMDNVLEATGIDPSEVSGITAAKEAELLCENKTDAISFILDLNAPQVDQIQKTCLMRRLVFSHDVLKAVLRSNATYYPINLGPTGRKDAYAVGLYVNLITYKGALSREDHQLVIESLRTMP